ncbi:hypothetical protein [Ornithinimicrobium kibberense]|uniref:hypothetical protein n=1 Tax=Ornithinimicrobium kibberense TaxID=282060 RepID=UPI003615A19B
MDAGTSGAGKPIKRRPAGQVSDQPRWPSARTASLAVGSGRAKVTSARSAGGARHPRT